MWLWLYVSPPCCCRKGPNVEEKRYRPKQPKPVRPYGDYYNEDYFYEYRPVHVNRRQGGG